MREQDYMKIMNNLREDYISEAVSWDGTAQKNRRSIRRMSLGVGAIAAAMAVVVGGIGYGIYRDRLTANPQLENSDITIEKLNNRDRSSITSTESALYNPRISAISCRITLSQWSENFRYKAVVTQISEQLTTSCNRSPLAQSQHFLYVRSQILCFRQSCNNLLVLQKSFCKAVKHSLSLRCISIEFSATNSVSHINSP